MAKILILEDEIELAAGWRSDLRAAGHDVQVARNSYEALERERETAFDLFIVDRTIRIDGEPSGAGGLFFMRRLLELDRYFGRLPLVIGVSGFRPMNSIDYTRDLFETLGAQRFLEKPVAAGELVEAVDGLLDDERRR